MGENEIRKQLKAFIMEHAIIPAKVGLVKEVDRQNLLIDVDPIDGGPTMFNIRLGVQKPGGKKAGVVMIPSNNSQVIIGQLQGGVWYLIQALEVETIYFNGEEMGGLVNWPKQRVELEKMSARIDRIENLLKSSPVVPTDGGAAFKSAITTGLSTPLPKENFGNLENKVVKHG